jgi:hypothetical protein
VANSTGDLEFSLLADDYCPHVTCALTKFDIGANWRTAAYRSHDNLVCRNGIVIWMVAYCGR